MSSGLAIIAGAGDLPRLIAEHCRTVGRDYALIQFNGIALDWAADHPIINAQFEKPKNLLKALAAAGLSEMTFAGAMIRPQLNPLKFDSKFLGLAPKLLPALKGGDNQTLGIITDFFEGEGLTLVGAHEIVQDLVLQAGCLTQNQPSDADKQDAIRAAEILLAMSEADLGQSVVVAQGLALGIESIQGTDVMLDFVAQTGKDLLPDPKGAKGLLFKAPKKGQDWRIDLPLIGPETVTNAAAAGLAGIVVRAGGVMVLDGTIQAADGAGLFLWARPDE